MVDWTQILANGLISSLFSALFALTSAYLARNWLKRKIYDFLNAYILVQVTYFQQNPDVLANIVAPMLSGLAKSAEIEGAGGQSFSLGPLNKIVPKGLRPLILQWITSKLVNAAGLPPEVAQIAKPGENPFK